MDAKKSERLDEVLALHGYTTGRSVRRLLQSRTVCVNGIRVTSVSYPFVRGEDALTVDGKVIPTPKNVYIMMNKAQDRVCTHAEGRHVSVFDGIAPELCKSEFLPVLHSVGRLDLDTEGLLLLTTDGKLSHRLTTPDFKVPKTYLVYLRDSLTQDEKDEYTLRVKEGVSIAKFRKSAAFTSAPARLEWVTSANPYCTLVSGNGSFDGLETVCLLTLTEGKFHEVKRLFWTLGNEVVFLKRIAFASLYLDVDLLPGEWRFLTDSEVYALWNSL